MQHFDWASKEPQPDGTPPPAAAPHVVQPAGEHVDVGERLNLLNAALARRNKPPVERGARRG